MNFNQKLILSGLGLGVLAILITSTQAADDDLPLDLIDCKKIMARIAKRTLKAFGQCSRELRTNVTGDKAMFEKKLGCAIKCTLHKMEILDDEGKVTKDKVQKFMDEMVPKDAHEFAHALTMECNVSYGEKLDPTEEFCESYRSYADCMQVTIADFADKTSCHPGGHH